MTDWYRNTEWSDEIAADFETRIARARAQKAQHMSIQGQALIARRPDVAEDLLARAVALGDEFETPRALASLAQARLALGNVDGALEAFEQALERQLALPNVISFQPADYLFLIGYFEREERLPAALPIADTLTDEGLFGPDPQVFAAKALVYQLAGRTAEATSYARQALPLVEEMGEAVGLGIDIGALRQRLASLAAG